MFRIVLRIVDHQLLPPSCGLSSGQQFDVLSLKTCLGGKISACARSGSTLTTSLCLNAVEEDAVQVYGVMEQCDPWALAVKACALILSKGKNSNLVAVDWSAWSVVEVADSELAYVSGLASPDQLGVLN